MDLQPTTIRPCLQVVLNTAITGNVSYKRKTLVPEYTAEDGAQHKVWNTDRATLDAAEHDEAVKTRGRCRSIISSLCSRSDFGLLCRKESREALYAAIAESRKLAREFNAKARITRVNVFALVGEVAGDDAEAVRSINSNMRTLLLDMERGVKNLDSQAIRKAAIEAKSLSQMLTTQPESRVKNAIDSARRVARKLVKAGEVAAREIDQQAMAALLYARTALVDLDAQAEIGDIEGESRAFDLQPGESVTLMRAEGSTRPIKFEL